VGHRPRRWPGPRRRSRGWDDGTRLLRQGHGRPSLAPRSVREPRDGLQRPTRRRCDGWGRLGGQATVRPHLGCNGPGDDDGRRYRAAQLAEGLAIGNSAAAGDISLALILVIGFALHNATEGFGIVAPLAGAPERPSWGRLALLGLIGGGPTLIGTLIGQRATNDTLAVAFLALAAGSVLYVIIELLAVARRTNLKELTSWCILAGLSAGFATDAILIAAGA